MLGALKHFFVKKVDSDSEIYEPELTNTNPNFLTNPEKINQLLKEIEDKSPLCIINIEGTSEEFSSSILDVQLQSGQIIIDELIPPQGNNLLIKKNKLKLSTIHKGIRLAFSLSNMETGSSRGIAYYKSAIPNRIYYPQRRSSPRITLISLNLTFSGISKRTQSSIGGNIFDISRTGIGITISNNRFRLQRGDLIVNCRVNLDDSTISFDIIIRFVKTPTQGLGKTIIGGYFENLSSKDQHKLEQFVISLEREEIRNRKK